MRATQVFLVLAVVLCSAVLLEAKPASKKNSPHAHKCKSNADCQKACNGHAGTCDAKKVCACDGKGGKHSSHKHPATKPSKVSAKAAASPATAPPGEGPANPSIPAEEAEAAAATPSAEDGANPSIPANNPSIPAEEAELPSTAPSEA